MNEVIDVREIRKSFGLTQAQFADRFGFNLGTLRHWEQGSRTPDRAASVLLAVVAKHPDIVLAMRAEMMPA
jgi:putative transcriptional regulator